MLSVKQIIRNIVPKWSKLSISWGILLFALWILPGGLVHKVLGVRFCCDSDEFWDLYLWLTIPPAVLLILMVLFSSDELAKNEIANDIDRKLLGASLPKWLVVTGMAIALGITIFGFAVAVAILQHVLSR